MGEEEQAEKGTEENPLTRADVKRLIRRNSLTAEGIDLSGKVFEDEIDLSGLRLRGIILNGAMLFRANFNGSDLTGGQLRAAKLIQAKFKCYTDKPSLKYANLRDADLSEADLTEAEFIGAFLPNTSFMNAGLSYANLSIEGRRAPDLHFTDFRGANLFSSDFTGRSFHFTKLEGAYINQAKLTEEHTYLGDADWGNYVIGEEKPRRDFYSAERRYRHLKQWYTNSGYYDIAGKFFFREMTVRRKMMKWWPNPLPHLWSKFVSAICGYGEKPERVILWAASVIGGLAIVYFLIGGVWQWAALWRSLYFSVVSFTALGYGSWMKATSDWMIGLGAFESFLGVFSMALFLVTFTRKMTR